jgi:hypothetical protein
MVDLLNSGRPCSHYVAIFSKLTRLILMKHLDGIPIFYYFLSIFRRRTKISRTGGCVNLALDEFIKHLDHEEKNLLIPAIFLYLLLNNALTRPMYVGSYRRACYN